MNYKHNKDQLESLRFIGYTIIALIMLICLAAMFFGTKWILTANAQEFDLKYNPPRGEVLSFGKELSGIIGELNTEPIVIDQSITLAKDIIRHYEGRHLEAYLDTHGYAICYGNRSEKGATATEDDCETRLTNRVLVLKDYVEARYDNLKPNEKAALISLYYNVHNPVHVEWRIKTGQSEKSVRNVWVAYHLANGEPLKGLKKRRIHEVNLFFNS